MSNDAFYFAFVANRHLVSRPDVHRISDELASTALDSGLFSLATTGNSTMDIFNVTSRIATDGEFLCVHNLRFSFLAVKLSRSKQVS